MNRPRSAFRLLEDTFELYGRYPVLFLTLAIAVIVPYELIAFAATGTGRFSRGDTGGLAQLFLAVADWVLVTPLVSALHVHAVADVRLAREPDIGLVARRGIEVLPVVAAATIIAALGTLIGFLALVIPGILLLLRWAVVTQAAAIEHEGWLAALRRSGRLSRGHYGHIAAFLILTGVIASGPFLIGVAIFGTSNASVAASLAGVALHVIVASFAALASALLYYDLVVRSEAELAAQSPTADAAEPAR